MLSQIISTFIHEVPALPKKSPGGKILDIGCGAGETLLLLKSLGWQTYGLEIDRQAVKVAQKMGLTDVKYGGYRNLTTYPDNYFDAIRLYHVFEHLDNPLLCLRLITRKVKKGGEVIIGTPNSSSFAARLFRRYWYNLDSPRHLFLFNPKLLKKLIFQAGLRPLKVEFCSAGGLLGSLQYYLREKNGLRIQLIHQPLLVILFYPLEWLLDKLSQGDVFVLRAVKV
ncbi:MAG: class I SAM-dependent methyltransferase [Patescibacteria group bacterium]